MFEFLKDEPESMRTLYTKVVDRHFKPAITDDDLNPDTHVRAVRGWIEAEGKKQAKEDKDAD